MTSVSARRSFVERTPMVRWRDVPAHVVMLVVMVGTMVGHSTVRDLAGLAALAVSAMLLARFARLDGRFRTHLVDFAAMTLVLVGCLPGHQPGTVHDHFAMPTGPLVFVVAIAGWAVGRTLLWRRTRDGRADAVMSGVVCGVGLVLMVAFCGHSVVG
jgi:hypothetical protein